MVLCVYYRDMIERIRTRSLKTQDANVAKALAREIEKMMSAEKVRAKFAASLPELAVRQKRIMQCETPPPYLSRPVEAKA